MVAKVGECRLGKLNKIEKIIEHSINLKKITFNDKELLNLIAQSAEAIIGTIKKGNKVLIAGNGGSAADSQHMAAELVSKFYHDRNAISAIALTTDTSILTSISNDYNYSNIFARQIEAIGRKGDIFIPITTSGNSENLIKAAQISKNKHIKVIGLTGNNGGKLKKYCDILLDINDTDTPRIQECHLMVEHILCELVEKELM